MDLGRRKFSGRYRVRRRGSDAQGEGARIRRSHLRPENAEASRRRILHEGQRSAAVPGRSLYLYYRFRGRSAHRLVFQQARSEISGETVFDLGPDRLREAAAVLRSGPDWHLTEDIY